MMRLFKFCIVFCLKTNFSFFGLFLCNCLFYLISDESPAFVCEKVSVELELERMTDMAVDDMIKTKNVLYISRGQLKNHTSTVLNFNIGLCVNQINLLVVVRTVLGVRYISQRVNMPLLRLLHQISNMYQNVKDTQNELREQQPMETTRPKTSASDNVDIKIHSSSGFICYKRYVIAIFVCACF